MKKQMSLNITVLVYLTVMILVGAGAASASPPPPNLRVLLSGPSSVQVYSPYLFAVNVKNIGGSTAVAVRVIVDLPETATSPQKYVLGTVSGIDPRCQLVSRKLNCLLGDLTKSGTGQTKEFTFNLALPVSTRSLQIKATASTTTAPEADPLNNAATLTPTPAYASNQLASATVLVSRCTGTGLSSFFECALFPDSQTHLVWSLNVDLTITYNGRFIGTWDQFASPQQLHFVLTGGSSSAEFSGFASSNTCFEGLTTFTPQSNYVSPYKVCVQ
jgi:hypothetical protein